MQKRDPMATGHEKKKERKTCKICGGLYIPTSNNQKFCPNCREILAAGGSEEKARAYAEKALPGEVTTYMVEPTPAEEIVTVEEDDATWEPEQDEVKAAVYDIVTGLIELIEKHTGTRLVRMDEFVPVPIKMGGKEFSGLYVRRSEW